MNEKKLSLCPNRVTAYLQKEADDLTKADIMKFIKEQGTEMVNLMYPADDGRLKTLSFVINNEEYIDEILTYGERVDGSSLFKSVGAENADLYVLPRYSTAFVDPFAKRPTLTMLCSYFDKDGKPAVIAPENTLRKACTTFREVTGMDFEAMGELEFYVIMPAGDGLYPATDQRGYHESSPYAKAGEFRAECMCYIAQAGGQIKYGHSEVGNFVMDGMIYEQNEIEFLPVPAEKTADQLMVAKWIIRNLASKYGYNVTFAPKITVGKAGSGLHIHMRMMKDGKNMMLEGGSLSCAARKAIAGMMDMAPSITAFGNKNPTSYFRLVPHQEAPTNVCWGDRNRSVLVRVPLGWTAEADMCGTANPKETQLENRGTGKGVASQRQTVEMRSPDGSANLYELVAALCVACRHGFEMENAMDVAERTYVNVNIHNDENSGRLAQLAQLPDSCMASADRLEAQRKVYEEHGVFAPQLIDSIIRQLRSYGDSTLREELEGDHDGLLALVNKYFHC